MAVEALSDEKKYIGNREALAANGVKKRRCLGGLRDSAPPPSTITFERNIGIRVPHHDMEDGI